MTGLSLKTLTTSVGKGGTYTCPSSSRNFGRYRTMVAHFTLPAKVDCKVINQEFFAGVWINDPEGNGCQRW